MESDLREKLEEAVSHVRKHDVDVYGPGHIAWMNARVYYFSDPDGNLLEFWSTDNAQHQLTNSPFTTPPVGSYQVARIDPGRRL